MIPGAEWRLEVRLSTSLFRNWKSHGIKCTISVVACRNTWIIEKALFFLKKTLDFLFMCFIHASTHVHPVSCIIIGFDDVNLIICKQVKCTLSFKTLKDQNTPYIKSHFTLNSKFHIHSWNCQKNKLTKSSTVQ